MRGSGEARLVASGAVLQQLAQGLGLVALLGIVTLLARRLEVAELGAYGLVASLAGYLLVLRNSVASAAVRAMASATDPEERSRVFAAAAALYVVVGLATGVLIAAAALAIAALVLDGELAREARIGGLGLGALTAVGIAASVYLDALRAERRFAQAAGCRDGRGRDLRGRDGHADPDGRQPRRPDGREWRAAAAERSALRPDRPALGTPSGSQTKRPRAPAHRGHRPHGRLAARDRAVEPRSCTPPGASFSVRTAVPRPWGCTRGRCAPTTSSTRWAARWPCRPCRPPRATWPRATSAVSGSWPFAGAATRSRCSCRCA